jgi:hypothetical protein
VTNAILNASPANILLLIASLANLIELILLCVNVLQDFMKILFNKMQNACLVNLNVFRAFLILFRAILVKVIESLLIAIVLMVLLMMEKLKCAKNVNFNALNVY